MSNLNFKGIAGQILDVSSDESRQAKVTLKNEYGFDNQTLFGMKNKTAIDLVNRLKASRL